MTKLPSGVQARLVAPRLLDLRLWRAGPCTRPRRCHMASAQTVRAAFAMVTSLLINGVVAAAAFAQATPMPPPIAGAPGAPGADVGSGGWIVAAVLVLGL